MSEEQDPPMKITEELPPFVSDDSQSEETPSNEQESPFSPVALFEMLDSEPLPTGRSLSLANGEELDLDEIEDPMIGEVIGNFRIVEVIGSGGFGKVYRADHTMLGEPFAVKLLKVDTQSNKEFVKRFQREARVLAQLKHEHVVSLADFGMLPNGGLYIIMEYLRGASLQQRLRAREPFPIPRMRRLVTQMCDVLGYIHRKKVIHRDLKPGNIFLVPDEEGREKLKLIDFGIAALHEDQNEPLTQTEAFLGTAKYASPEQIVGEVELDHRSDLYAFGILLYRLLSGRLPFRGKGVMSIINQQLNQAPPALTALFPERRWSPKLEAFLQVAMAKERDDRPQHAQVFGALCDAALREQYDIDLSEGQGHTGVFMSTLMGRSPSEYSASHAQLPSEPNPPSRSGSLSQNSLSQSSLTGSEQRRLREAQRLAQITSPARSLDSSSEGRPSASLQRMGQFGQLGTPVATHAQSGSIPLSFLDDPKRLSSSPRVSSSTSQSQAPLFDEASSNTSGFTVAAPSQQLTGQHPPTLGGGRFWLRLIVLLIVGSACGYGALFGITQLWKPGRTASSKTIGVAPVAELPPPTGKSTLERKAPVALAPALPRPAAPRVELRLPAIRPRNVVRVRPAVRKARRHLRRRRVWRRRPPRRRPVAVEGPCGALLPGHLWLVATLKEPRRGRPQIRFIGCASCRKVRKAGVTCLALPVAKAKVRISVIVDGYQPCLHNLSTKARQVLWRLREDDPGGLSVSNYQCAWTLP